MIRNKQIFRYLKIIIGVYAVLGLILGAILEKAQPDYFMGKLMREGRPIIGIIGVVFYIASLALVMWMFLKYCKEEPEDGMYFEIYKKSSIFKLYQALKIISIIFCLYNTVISLETRYFFNVDTKTLLFNMFYFILKFGIPYLMLYAVFFVGGGYFGFNESWLNRKYQTKALKNILNDETIIYDNYKIVLFEDDQNILDNYFSTKSLDKEYEKNREISLNMNTQSSYFYNLLSYKSKILETLFSVDGKYANIVYLNKKDDIEFLKKEFPDADVEKILSRYVVLYIKTAKSEDGYENELEKFKKEGDEKFNQLQMSEMIVFDKLGNFKKPENMEYMDFMYVCDMENYSLKAEEICKKPFGYLEFEEEYNIPIITEFQPSCGYNLYKNSYLCNSEYQEMLLLFNYMIYSSQIIAYYMYLKNTNSSSKEINSEILSDSYDVLFQAILDNYNGYHLNIKKKIELPDWITNILTEHMEELLDIEFKKEGDKIYLSFAGLGDLLTLLRNRVQSHGNINQNNVSEIIKLLRALAIYFNYFLCMDKLEVKNETDGVHIGYGKNSDICMGRYVISSNDITMVAQRKAKRSNKYRYIDYFKGTHSRPEEVEI